MDLATEKRRVVVTHQSGLSDETAQSFVLALLRQGFTHGQIKNVIHDKAHAKAVVEAIRDVRLDDVRQVSASTQPKHVTKPATGDSGSGLVMSNPSNACIWRMQA